MGSAGQPSDPWADPLPVSATVGLPSFPVDALPGPLAAYVTGLSRATQTPVDLPGSVVVGVLAAALQGRLQVRVAPDWVEPTHLYTCPVLAPGTRKTAVVMAARAPLDDVERDLRAAHAGTVGGLVVERDIRERHATRCRDAAAKAADPALMAEALDAAEAAGAVIVPAPPRLTCEDSTPETLITMMAEQGGAIAAISDEAGVFEALTGRYLSRPNLDPLLKAHAGARIQVDRRGRAEDIEHPALTIVASVQPYALAALAGREDMAGRGLLARVLWVLPRDTVGYRDVDPDQLGIDVKEGYHQVVAAVARWASGRDAASVVALSPDARAHLVAYMARLEPRLRDGAEYGVPSVRAWAAKLAGAVVRLAGGLYVASVGPQRIGEPISAATISAATRLGDYYAAHALAALTPGDTPETRRAEHVLDVVMTRADFAEPFTQRDVHRRVRREYQTAEHMSGALADLAYLGWVRLSADGRRWERHPAPPTPADSADSADSATNPQVREPAGRAEDVSAALTCADNSGECQQPSAVPLTTGSAADLRKHTTVSAVSAVSAPWCAACGHAIDPAAGTVHPGCDPDRSGMTTITPYSERIMT
jgi:hypothetical protein